MFKYFSVWVEEGIFLAIVLFLVWLAWGVKGKLFRKLEGKLNIGSLKVFERTVSTLILFIGLLLVLQILGIDIMPLLTLSGIGAAALGFASRDLFANLFGGVMIFITRPFRMNDTIEIPAKKITGTVEEIGWYLTTIRDADKKSLYIPNSFFLTELLVNDSRITHRLIDERLHCQLLKGPEIECLREMVRSHPGIDSSQPVEVFATYLGRFGAEVQMKAYTRTTQYLKYREIKQELLFKAHEILEGV